MAHINKMAQPRKFSTILAQLLKAGDPSAFRRSRGSLSVYIQRSFGSINQSPADVGILRESQSNIYSVFLICYLPITLLHFLCAHLLTNNAQTRKKIMSRESMTVSFVGRSPSTIAGHFGETNGGDGRS